MILNNCQEGMGEEVFSGKLYISEEMLESMIRNFIESKMMPSDPAGSKHVLEREKNRLLYLTESIIAPHEQDLVGYVEFFPPFTGTIPVLIRVFCCQNELIFRWEKLVYYLKTAIRFHKDASAFYRMSTSVQLALLSNPKFIDLTEIEQDKILYSSKSIPEILNHFGIPYDEMDFLESPPLDISVLESPPLNTDDPDLPEFGPDVIEEPRFYLDSPTPDISRKDGKVIINRSKRAKKQKKRKWGPRKYSLDRVIKVVMKWEKLKENPSGINLEEFLESEFGSSGGENRVPRSTFHTWQTKVLNGDWELGTLPTTSV